MILFLKSTFAKQNRWHVVSLHHVYQSINDQILKREGTDPSPSGEFPVSSEGNVTSSANLHPLEMKHRCASGAIGWKCCILGLEFCYHLWEFQERR